MNEENDNVIHIRFGGGGVKTEPPSEPELTNRADPIETLDEDELPPSSDDPIASLYTMSEVSRLFELSIGRLRYWDRAGFISPSVTRGSRRYYNFQDLVGIRTAKGLIDAGARLSQVKRSLEVLRSTLPKVIRPLNELRIIADGPSVLIRDRGSKYEPLTGQLHLDFEVSGIADEVVKRLRDAPYAADRASAYEYYLEGCRLDEDEASFDRAEAAYRKAIELDPSLANAYTNLGNLEYRRGNIDAARREYERALSIDAEQPEAFYNLGFLALEHGDAESAVDLFRQALSSDPGFSDAHFNLALAYEELGQYRDARAHWHEYLSLEPTGAWAEIARRHLAAAGG